MRRAYVPSGVLITAILLLAALWLLPNEASDLVGREVQVVATFLITLITGTILFAWLMVFSRLRWRTRLSVVGSSILGLICASSLVRIEGFSGDLAPMLSWRWQRVRGTSVGELLPADNDVADPLDLANAEAHQNWPQFLGPTRDGVVKDITVPTTWGSNPPRPLWQREIGSGCSGFAIYGENAITQEQRGEHEYVVCYSVKSGKQRWQCEVDGALQTMLGGDGPRATPTIDGEFIYAVTARGKLCCLQSTTGSVAWSVELYGSGTTATVEYGVSCSPLVVNDLVIVSPGIAPDRALVAFHARTGEIVWHGGTDAASYSSPMIANLSGLSQVLMFGKQSLCAYDLADGKLLWRYDWPTPVDEHNIAQPVAVGTDKVLLATAHLPSTALIQIRCHEGNWSVREVWRNRNLKSKFSNVVALGGYAYGLDNGILVCLDLASGERRWKQGRYGHGQVLLMGDVLVIQSESGEISLVAGSPVQLQELCRFEALAAKTWNAPAITAGFLLVRGDRQAACYRFE